MRETVRHVLVTGPGQNGRSAPAALAGPGRAGALLRGTAGGAARLRSTGQTWTSVPPPPCATPAAPPGMPKGVVYSHRSAYLHSMGVCMGNTLGLSEHDRVLPVVPMFHANAWGLAYAAVMSGADLIMPDRFLQPEPLVRLIEAERPTVAGAVPDDLERAAPACARARRRPLVAADGPVRRLGRPACADGGLREGTRRADRPGLGDDGDLADRQRGAPARRDAGRGGLALPRHPGPAGLRRGGPAGRGRRRRRCPTTARRSARSRCAARG